MSEMEKLPQNQRLTKTIEEDVGGHLNFLTYEHITRNHGHANNSKVTFILSRSPPLPSTIAGKSKYY